MSDISDHKVDFKILIRAEPQNVYDAFTTTEGLDGWFTRGAHIDPKPGGEIIFRWKNWGPDHYNGENSGPVLEADRPARFVFRWKSDNLKYMNTVEINFKAAEQGTLVRLIEYGFPDSNAGIRDLADRSAGWGQALTLMKFYIEHGVRY
jgi:uncharacterized protein YndB with AHSA1/START domain